MKLSITLIILFFLVSAVVPAGSKADETAAPEKYELKLIYLDDETAAKFIFVIGNSGFQSVERLKQFLGSRPKGSEVVWNPGCERIGSEPLLSSDKDMQAFRIFLKEHGIKFTLIPSG